MIFLNFLIWLFLIWFCIFQIQRWPTWIDVVRGWVSGIQSQQWKICWYKKIWTLVCQLRKCGWAQCQILLLSHQQVNRICNRQTSGDIFLLNDVWIQKNWRNLYYFKLFGCFHSKNWHFSAKCYFISSTGKKILDGTRRVVTFFFQNDKTEKIPDFVINYFLSLSDAFVTSKKDLSLY